MIFIPNNPTQDFKKIADTVDCLIITGGDDSTIRRLTEIRLATEILKQKKPILGVCHGAFLLTDLLGGKVNACDHHMDTQHDVYYLGMAHNVNSYHSQTITSLHSKASSLAQDADGNHEAWIDGDIAGIVWHPERMATPWVPAEISNRFQIY